jgi:O-acetyl-ADP-ribose deacetylase (regulator of RNase III)
MAAGNLFAIGPGVELQLVQGDITKIRVDAIVNAANSALAGGGGVDGAIHAAGGPEVMAELDVIRKQIGRCEPGNAVVTSAGRLPARYVFHAVGPRYRDGGSTESSTLGRCYETCLRLARELDVKIISFPSISTGVYGYPVGEAAEIAIRTVVHALRSDPGALREVKLVQFSTSDHQIYLEIAQRVFGQTASAG